MHLVDADGVPEAISVVSVVIEDEVHVVLEGAELDLHFGRVVHLVVLHKNAMRLNSRKEGKVCCGTSVTNDLKRDS